MRCALVRPFFEAMYTPPCEQSGNYMRGNYNYTDIIIMMYDYTYNR
jgi:hypothetical protein